MSTQESILAELKTLNITVGNLDVAMRGPQDGSRVGVIGEQAQQSSRIRRLEAGLIGSGGAGTVLAIVYALVS